MFKFLALAALCSVASAGTWAKGPDISDVIVALQCTNSTTCYAAGAASSSEGEAGIAALFITHDQGATWTSKPANGLLPLAVAAEPPLFLIGTLFDQEVSHDNGNTWKTSNFLQSQDARVAHKTFYVIGSSLSGKNAVSVSTDGGETFKQVDLAPAAKTSARYGAFPTPSDMYVSAGTWPENNDDDAPPSKLLGQRIPSVGNTTGTWAGQIVASHDAGKTWSSSFFTTDFYFNEIDCEDATHCCAAGEADSSAKPGVRIMCTDDGATWTVRFQTSNADDSLMEMQSMGNGKWMAGGTFASQSAGPAFISSVDGGKTWTVDTPTNLGEVAVIDLSCPNPDACLALAIDQFNSLEVITYTA